MARFLRFSQYIRRDEVAQAEQRCIQLVVAEICCLVNQMGGEKPLAQEHVVDMLRLRAKMGMSMPGDKNLLK